MRSPTGWVTLSKPPEMDGMSVAGCEARVVGNGGPKARRFRFRDSSLMLTDHSCFILGCLAFYASSRTRMCLLIVICA